MFGFVAIGTEINIFGCNNYVQMQYGVGKCDIGILQFLVMAQIFVVFTTVSSSSLENCVCVCVCMRTRLRACMHVCKVLFRTFEHVWFYRYWD